RSVISRHGTTTPSCLCGTASRQKNFPRDDGDDDNKGSAPFVQIQRMGQTLVKTVFIPVTQRDRYNASVPAHDLADLNNPNKFSLPPGAPGFSRFIPDALTTSGTPGDAGNTTAARADLLTAIGVATLPNG